MPTDQLNRAIRNLHAAIRKHDSRIWSLREREHTMRPALYQRERQELHAEARRAIHDARRDVDAALQESRTEARDRSPFTAEQSAQRTLHATRAGAMRDDARALRAAIHQSLDRGDKAAAQEYLLIGQTALQRDYASELPQLQARAASRSDTTEAATLAGLDTVEQRLSWLDQHLSTVNDRLGSGNLDEPENREDVAEVVSRWHTTTSEQAADAASNHVKHQQALAEGGTRWVETGQQRGGDNSEDGGDK